MPTRIDSRVLAAMLVAVVLAEAVFVVAANAPGRANVDVVHSANQALGTIPYDDWHPPVMAALWGALIALTGTVASLFYAQVIVFFGSVLVMAFALWSLTGRRLVAGVVAALPVLPYVLTQLGMVWKDTLMTVALVAAVAALLAATAWARERPRARVSLVLIAIGFLLFGTLVRKNAAFAIVPLLLWALVLLWPRLVASGWRLKIVAAVAVTGVFGGVTVATGALLDRAYDVRPTSQISQVYLDDVIFSVPYEDIEAADIPAPLKERLMWAKGKCEYMGYRSDAYWNCYGRGAAGTNFSPIAYQEELRDLWREEVLSHPGRYLEYRVEIFGDYLTTVSLEYWPTRWNGEAGTVGLGPERSPAESAQGTYVDGLAATYVPWLFLPAFWLVVLVLEAVAALVVRRGGRLRWPAFALATSGMIYVLGYFPIIPANHFRYTYWPAVAGSLAAVCVTVSLIRARGARAASGPSDTP